MEIYKIKPDKFEEKYKFTEKETRRITKKTKQKNTSEKNKHPLITDH